MSVPVFCFAMITWFLLLIFLWFCGYMALLLHALFSLQRGRMAIDLGAGGEKREIKGGNLVSKNRETH